MTEPTSPTPSTPQTDDDGGTSLQPALYTVLAVGVLASLAGFAFGGTRMGTSVSFGAAIAWSNLFVLGKVIKALVPESPDEPVSSSHDAVDTRRRGRYTWAWSVLALVKLVVLFGGIYWALDANLVAPIPLVLGYAALPVGIAFSGLARNLGPRPRAPRK